MFFSKMPISTILVIAHLSLTTNAWELFKPDGYDTNKTSEAVPLESLDELNKELEVKSKLFEERIQFFESIKKQVDLETDESALVLQDSKILEYKHANFFRILILVTAMIFITIVLNFLLNKIKRQAKSVYGYFYSYFYMKYWCSERVSQNFKHDKLAMYNNQVALMSSDVFCSHEVYTRPAPFEENVYRRVGKVTHGVELNDCNMCLRSLIDIKRDGLSFKATECGHVYCLKCMNNWFKSNNLQFKCPTCLRDLKRDQIIHVRNIFI